MSDLISRQEVYNMLNGLGGCDARDEWSKGWDKAIDTAISELDDISTAHDVDKVVYQLQENTHYDGERCYFIPEEAIRIVKAGGANE